MRLANQIGIVTAAASGMAVPARCASPAGRLGRGRILTRRRRRVVAEITAAGDGIAGDLRQDASSRHRPPHGQPVRPGRLVWNHVSHPGPAAIEGIDMADFAGDRPQPADCTRDNRGCNPRNAGAWWRRAALHRVDLRPGRFGLQPGLFDGEVRRRRFRARTGQAPRARQDPRQRYLPRPDRHADAARLRRTT